MKTLLGKPYLTTDGIEWQIALETYTAQYPYVHTVGHYVAEPTARGRQSLAYKAERDSLGDDWSRDLTDSEYLIDNLIQAGMSSDEIMAVLNDAHELRAARYQSVDHARRLARIRQ